MVKKMTTHIPCSSINTARELLEHLQQEHQFSLHAPINIDNIAKLLEIRVENYTSFDDVVGTIQASDKENESAIVRINNLNNNYEPRRRFTLAHEIGHLCQHLQDNKSGFTDTSKSMSRTESYWDTLESEANSFAAQLLMPKELVLSIGKEIIAAYKTEYACDKIPRKKFIELMSSEFKVSNPAMRYRLKNLGVVK